MREDMDKILVERPRIGHRQGEATSRHARRTYKQGLRHTGGDSDSEYGFGTAESITAPSKNNYKCNPKELNENLKPLRRFLRSRVGKPWNDVYSEIMEGINLNNAVQYHVWQHLVSFGEVDTKTFMEGNTVMVSGYGGPEPLGDWYSDQFYVHPKTGLLCFMEGKKFKYRKVAWTQLSYIDLKKPLVQYHQVDGIWYEFQMRAATQDEVTKKMFGAWKKTFDSNFKPVYRWESSYDSGLVGVVAQGRGSGNYNYGLDSLWKRCHDLFGGPYLPLRKRQIGSREIRRIEGLIQNRKKAA